MTALWTSDAIAEAIGGKASHRFEVTGVAFDSREVTPGETAGQGRNAGRWWKAISAVP